MYELNPIGIMEKDGEHVRIRVERKYHDAWKHLEKFSHIHVFYGYERNGKWVFSTSVAEIDNIGKTGIISLKGRMTIEKGLLFDIKPYFPCEDAIRPELLGESNLSNTREWKLEKEAESFRLEECGMIRKKNGKVWIECKQQLLKETGFVKVLWWFHRFDKPSYRRATQCNPPYENAPRTGIFASRSPVRPNPIAMTTVEITGQSEDGKKLYLKDIECFDKTPCIGIYPYEREKDLFIGVKVPDWLAHWPQWFREEEKRNAEKPEIEQSPLSSMLTGNVTDEIIDMTRVSYTPDGIVLKGGYENNLKKIDVTIPYGKITAVTGVSGSGKSSLVQDTIYAECKRRMEYLNSDSHIMARPRMESMSGCIPTVLVSQKPIGANRNSTIGTYTGIFDELRAVYAEVGIRHCPDCGGEIIPLTKEDILELLSDKEPIIYDLDRNRIKGETLEKQVEQALERGKGAFLARVKQSGEILLQTKQKCFRCNRLMFEMTPSVFSYLDLESRCQVCNGTGFVYEPDEKKIVEHPEKSLLDGASSFWGRLRAFRDNPNANWMKGQILGLAEDMGVDLEVPWQELPEEFRNRALQGAGEHEVTFRYQNKNGRNGEITRPVEGVFSIINRFFEEHPDSTQLSRYMTQTACTVCGGERLSAEGRSVTIGRIRYPQAASMTFAELELFCHEIPQMLGNVRFSRVRNHVINLIEYCQAARKLGISYLPLSRGTSMISGGEAQRLKLLTVLFSSMSGILYVFDEPSKGLSPQDYDCIIEVFQKLRREGNTILMVEHNADMIRCADYILEIGQGAGENGGRLIGEGTLTDIVNGGTTQTGRYLKGEIPRLLTKKAKDSFQFLTLEKLCTNNLKNISVRFPIQALTCICGVSGSGKSSLLKGEIYPAFSKSKCFLETVLVDQSPIGRTSRSVLATYVGIMDTIRKMFASTEEAKANGFNESFFSFNGKEGQCENCSGEGRIHLNFTEDATVCCPVCHGKRYKKSVLSIKYHEKSMDEVLELSVEKAAEFFENTLEISEKLSVLEEVGLSYLTLSQSALTFSGGEAARLKLARELMGRKKSNVLYLLDEPTTGLHFSDIEMLLRLMQKLLDAGNTVIAIEHNRQFVENADWILKMGPGAGNAGGYCEEVL